MTTGLQFAYRKAAQALNFFAIQNGGQIGKLPVLKLVYLADRYHLRKYGRPITNDQYWAMRLGPVASGVKDLCELQPVSSEERHYVTAVLEPGTKPHAIRSRRAVDAQVFSDTDLEALRFAWDTFGAGRRHGIVEQTHKYPEWKRHEAALTAASRVPMDYMDFLEDPPPGVNPCYPLSAEERADRRDQLRETTDALSLWR